MSRKQDEREPITMHYTLSNWNKQHQKGFVKDSHLIDNVEVVALISLRDYDFSRDGGVWEHCVKNVRSLIFVQMTKQHVFGNGLGK